jgi:hypothetical protein
MKRILATSHATPNRVIAALSLVLVTILTVGLNSCVSVGLDEATKKELQDVRKEAGDLADKVTKRFDNLCEAVNAFRTDAEAACAGIAAEAERRRCVDIARQKKDLLERIKKACEEAKK